MVEPKIAALMDAHQNEMIKKTLELSVATKKMKTVEKLAEYEKKEIQLKHDNQMYESKLAQKIKMEQLDNQAAIAEQKRAEAQAEVDAKGAMQAVLNAIHKDQLARDKAVDDAKIETEHRLAEIEAAKQKAYAETVEKIMKSIQPELVAAMNAKANAEIMNGLGEAISPAALANGESVAEAMSTLLRGTSLEKTLKNIVTASSN